jgi:hypothetical protein
MDGRSLPARFAARRQYWFIAGLLLFFFLLSIQYSYKALAGRSAFVRWRSQLEQLDDVDIYQQFNYPNPPIMALLLEGLARLPPLAGSLAWFYLKVAMALAAFAWVFRLVETRQAPCPPWAKALAVILSLRPIMGDLSHNNVNLFVLFLVTGSLFAYQRGRDMLSGTVMGLAIACKVTPALFIPYFLWKRAWKSLIGCVLGLVLFLLVVPGIFLGMDRNWELLSSWKKQMIEPFLVNGVVTSEHNNQSLPGLAFRLATRSPAFSKFDYDLYKYVPQEYCNLWSLDPKTVHWFVKGIMAAFAIMVIWACQTPTTLRWGWPLAAEFSLVALGMLLFSERTWKHHCVTLMLPLTVLSYYLAAGRPGRGLRAYLIGTLATVALLMASTSINGLTPWWDRGAKLAQVYGAYVWVYVLLAAALVVLLRHNATQPKNFSREFSASSDSSIVSAPSESACRQMEMAC